MHDRDADGFPVAERCRGLGPCPGEMALRCRSNRNDPELSAHSSLLRNTPMVGVEHASGRHVVSGDDMDVSDAPLAREGGPVEGESVWEMRRGTRAREVSAR